MLPPFAIPPCSEAMRLHTRSIQEVLMLVSLDRAPKTGTGALAAQRASAADAFARYVFDRAPGGMQAARPQHLRGRAAISVARGIITKCALGEDLPLVMVVLPLGGVTHMGSDTSIL